MFVPFEELPQHHEESIQTRGFLYSLDDNTWILAAQPNLKSCCVGNATKQHEQVIVQVDLKDVPQTAVEIRGFFKIQDKKYILEDAVLIERELGYSSWVMGVVVVLGLLLFVLNKRSI